MTAVGIDVGKSSLDLGIDGQAGVVRYANGQAGIAKLVKRLQALGAERIVVEATGGYEEPLLEACCDADVPPVLSSTAIWSPIPQSEEIGREEALFRRADHRLPARGRGR
ncbi:hypothetical protein WCE34_14340, partial [Luteimonas sp. MJ204]